MSDISVVMIAVLIIWAGVFLYLVAIDRKVARLRREMQR